MAARFHAGWPAGEIAEAIGVSVRTVYKWLERDRRGGAAALPTPVQRLRAWPIG